MSHDAGKCQQLSNMPDFLCHGHEIAEFWSCDSTRGKGTASTDVCLPCVPCSQKIRVRNSTNQANLGRVGKEYGAVYCAFKGCFGMTSVSKFSGGTVTARQRVVLLSLLQNGHRTKSKAKRERAQEHSLHLIFVVLSATLKSWFGKCSRSKTSMFSDLSGVLIVVLWFLNVSFPDIGWNKSTLS